MISCKFLSGLLSKVGSLLHPKKRFLYFIILEILNNFNSKFKIYILHIIFRIHTKLSIIYILKQRFGRKRGIEGSSLNE